MSSPKGQSAVSHGCNPTSILFDTLFKGSLFVAFESAVELPTGKMEQSQVLVGIQALMACMTQCDQVLVVS